MLAINHTHTHTHTHTCCESAQMQSFAIVSTLASVCHSSPNLCDRRTSQRWNRVWTFDPWPDTYSHWVCFELRDYFDDGSECFLPKVSCTRSTHADHEHFQHNCKFIRYWKVKNKMLIWDNCNLASLFSGEMTLAWNWNWDCLTAVLSQYSPAM